MDWSSAVFHLLLGILIGFILGYIVGSLREIRNKVEEVDEIVKHQEHDRSRENGFMRIPIVADLALLTVVIMTVWAAFASQGASNDVKDNQQDIARSSMCTQQYLAKTIAALNERTTYTQDRANTNVELQKAQAAFLSVALENPPPSDERLRANLETYFEALTKFVDASDRSNANLMQNPYPTTEELAACLESKD